MLAGMTTGTRSAVGPRRYPAGHEVSAAPRSQADLHGRIRHLHPPEAPSGRDPSGGETRHGTALLRLQTTHSREGLLDGAWWPRSRNVTAELPPAPMQALTAHLGPITRVGLDTAAWEEVPTRLVVDDRVVHLDAFPVGDDTVLITRGDNDHFALLTTTSPSWWCRRTRHLMRHVTPWPRAVDAGNVIQAADILVATLPEPATDRQESG
ncbi:DUF5994 family protein [Streptomyces sp. NPDC058240]|uniref:DUF5994 family protein n=1 Tax=Streptomyces sp. NPDC058240 TaxID=3346396 RepID=UPI0036EB29D8